MKILTTAEIIPFKNFKEKIDLTKEFDGQAKVEVIEDRYVYVETMKEEYYE